MIKTLNKDIDNVEWSSLMILQSIQPRDILEIISKVTLSQFKI